MRNVRQKRFCLIVFLFDSKKKTIKSHIKQSFNITYKNRRCDIFSKFHRETTTHKNFDDNSTNDKNDVYRKMNREKFFQSIYNVKNKKHEKTNLIRFNRKIDVNEFRFFEKK